MKQRITENPHTVLSELGKTEGNRDLNRLGTKILHGTRELLLEKTLAEETLAARETLITSAQLETANTYSL